MNTLSIRRFGLAVGATCALLQLGCVLVMGALPKEAAIRFFNSLTHGVDWTPIVRWNIPAWESAVGVVELFILGWLVGAVAAAFYNLGGSTADHAPELTDRAGNTRAATK